MSRHSAGDRRYRIARISPLMQTDFPEPAAPAMRRWGICTKSITCASPVIFLPNMTGISGFLPSRWSSSSMISMKDTMFRLALGISIPTVCFPGKGATIRIEAAASLRAILSWRLTILESFTPGAGRISNTVITGPRRIPATSA